jgi:hypothetical protein
VRGFLSVARWFLIVVGAVTVFMLTATKVFGPQNYGELAKREFGTPEAIADLTTLYAKVEAAGYTLKLVPSSSNGATEAAVTRWKATARWRKIPRAWLPERYGNSLWATNPDLEPQFVQSRDVVAYYDDRDTLLGIWFYGSRWGCFVTRDPERCPPWFGTLRRLATEPLYVSSWTIEGLNME